MTAVLNELKTFSSRKTNRPLEVKTPTPTPKDPGLVSCGPEINPPRPNDNFASTQIRFFAKKNSLSAKIENYGCGQKSFVAAEFCKFCDKHRFLTKPRNKNGSQALRGLHSTEVAFALLTQQPRVRISVPPRFFSSVEISTLLLSS